MIKTKLVFLFIFFSSFSFGQNAIGFKAGGHLAKMKGTFESITELELSQKYKFGLQIGAIYELAINDEISIQSEFLYLQKGTIRKEEFMDEFNSISIETNQTRNYIELPILAKIKFGNLQSLNYYAILGPSFGYVLSGEVEVTQIRNGETQFQTLEDETITFDGFNRHEISAVLGGGINMPIGPARLFIEGRYLLGVSNLLAGGSLPSILKNRGFSMAAGIMIPLEKSEDSLTDVIDK